MSFSTKVKNITFEREQAEKKIAANYDCSLNLTSHLTSKIYGTGR